jgi:amino acid adenylation domain-containing protein
MSDVQIEGYQLSPQQRHVWSLCRHDGSGAYRGWLRARIRGPLDVGTMERAIEDAVARNEILRTSFRALEEVEAPLQVVSENVKASFRAHDLSGLHRSAAGRSIEEIETEIVGPWDLMRPPLFRVRLASIGPEEHLLWIGAPSVCTDASGLDNLMAALVDYYERRLENEDPHDEPLQYVDASTWLNEVLDSDDTATGRDFWRQHDLGSLRDAKLPFERRDPTAPFSPRRVELDLPSTLASSRDPSPELLLMTCWQWLLSSLTGETALLVSKSSTARNYEELETALGIFARHLPLAGELEGSLTAREASKRLGVTTSESEKWGLCFDRSRFDRGADAPRLDYAPYVFQSLARPGPFRVGDTEFEIDERRAVIDRFKLELVYETQGDRSKASIEFDDGLYRQEDISRFARELETLVGEALARPDSTLEELNLLPGSERRWLVEELNDATAELPREMTIHRSIESRAREFPDRLAVVCGDESMRYDDLERDSNRLARRLVAMGIGPEKTVAFRLERSPETVVTMLAILKAGGAYVPLDPKLPATRAHWMLSASGASLLVSRRELVADGPPCPVSTLLLDRERASILAEPDGALETNVGPRNLAYVLFTSGSTGRPKGVAIEHRQLVNYTRAIAERIGLASGMRFASVTTLGADLGNTSIYSALCGGGTLDLVPEDCVADPDAFSEYATAHRIDVLKIVPSHLEMLLTASRPSGVLPRTLLILGGEPCSWHLVQRVRSIAPGLAVLNHYGPTETTVGVTTYSIGAEPQDVSARTVPIGRPLANVRAYVLDERREPVPVWGRGELYIGGANVGRGYLQGSASDEGRFCPDPYSPRAEARMYRTGDLARVLPTGDLEFLGRADDQVKLRGYRVELGEIEAALRAHPEVQDAAILLRRDSEDDPRLVGYVVMKAGRSLDARHLREFLSADLPEFMVPSALVALAALPLNANGKLDRRALPAPVEAASGDGAGPEAGLSAWETVVRDVWRKVLRLDDVSVHDNFYDLGGHSLMAIRVVSDLGKRTGLHVSPRELVFHTLRQFAAVCESKKPDPAAVS